MEEGIELELEAASFSGTSFPERCRMTSGLSVVSPLMF